MATIPGFVLCKGLLERSVTQTTQFFFDRANRLNTKVIEIAHPKAKVVTKHGDLSLYCENSILLGRARTFFSKEPDTLRWIDSFECGEILFDVGANIGLYSLYAALRGINVFAFEPEATNYALLNRNIQLNALQGRVSAFNIAISDCSEFDFLHLSQTLPGSACHSFAETTDYTGKSFTPKFSQGATAFSLDEIYTRKPFRVPNHLKIDVDGLEPKIVDGAKKLLASNELKSILIELNVDLDDDTRAITLIESAGFKCVEKYHAEMFDNSPFKNIFNFTFRRT